MKKDMTSSMNPTTKRKNQRIEKIISIAIVMSLLTQLLSPKILVCLFISDLIMLFILVLYPNRKNQAFYQNVLLTVVGTWSGILMMKFIMGRRMRLLTQAEICFLCIMLAETCLILRHCTKKQTAKEEEKKLYPEREADLQRIAFLTTPIFTRLMSTEQYGQVTMYNSWLEIFTIFATLNLFYGVYNNALTKYSEDKEQVTSSMLGLCTTITLCVFVLYLCFQGWINKLTGMSTLMTCILFGEVLFIPAFRFWSAKQRFEYKYKALVFASLVISILTPLLGVPAVLLSTEKGYAKILTGVFSQVLVAVILYVLIFKNGRKFYHKNYWKYALAFNLPLIPHYLSSTVLNQCDRVMIDNMCGTDKAGIYGLAYTIGALAIIFNEAIMNSFTPWTYQHLKAEKYEEVKDVSRYLVVFIAIISLGIVLVAPEIVWILGGEKYAEGAWIIAPIAASIFFRFLYGLYGNIEFYYEENYFIMVASMICAVLNIILNYVFIKQYGYLAAGFTTLACYAFYSI